MDRGTKDRRDREQIYKISVGISDNDINIHYTWRNEKKHTSNRNGEKGDTIQRKYQTRQRVIKWV